MRTSKNQRPRFFKKWLWQHNRDQKLGQRHRRNLRRAKNAQKISKKRKNSCVSFQWRNPSENLSQTTAMQPRINRFHWTKPVNSSKKWQHTWKTLELLQSPTSEQKLHTIAREAECERSKSWRYGLTGRWRKIANKKSKGRVHMERPHMVIVWFRREQIERDRFWERTVLRRRTVLTWNFGLGFRSSKNGQKKRTPTFVSTTTS